MRKLVAVAMACLLLFSISGCREPGLFGKLKGYKVGVTWEGEPSYSWLVSQEAKRRTRLAIVDDNSIPELADYQSSLELLGDKHNWTMFCLQPGPCRSHGAEEQLLCASRPQDQRGL